MNDDIQIVIVDGPWHVCPGTFTIDSDGIIRCPTGDDAPHIVQECG